MKIVEVENGLSQLAVSPSGRVSKRTETTCTCWQMFIDSLSPAADVTLRRSQPSDADAIFRLWQLCHTPGSPHSLLPPPPIDTVRSLFADLLSVVAVTPSKEGEDIVGFVSANTAQHHFNLTAPPLVAAQQAFPSAAGTGAFLVGPVAVHESYRGSGLFLRLHSELRKELGLENSRLKLDKDGMRWDLGVVMINKANIPSVKAHGKLPGLAPCASFSCEANGANYTLLSFNL